MNNMNLRELIQLIKPSVCQVIAYTDSGTYRGSGFFVRDTTRIVTCHHVVKPYGTNTSKVEVLLDREPYIIPPTAIQNIASADLAILDVTNSKIPQVRGLTLGNFSDAEEGDEILVIGFPLGETILTTHKGIISSKARFQFQEPPVTVDCFKLDASINVGNSGGPCSITKDGRVIGVISAKAPVSAAISYRIGQEIRQAKADLLKRPGKVMLGGVDPIELSINVADTLYQAIEETRQLGIGYAISVDYLKPYL
jgi:S1-C subfamily serine protease